MIEDKRAFAVQRRLVDCGVVTPLSLDPDEVRRWRAWELASLIEGYFHHIVDTQVLPERQRAEWEQRVAFRQHGLCDPHQSHVLPCWLLSGNERVGTLAIQSFSAGMTDVCVASLYVRPGARLRGIATRALDAIYAAALDLGAGGLRIPTNWCWQNAVRFYTNRGLWVLNWKHSLVFIRRTDLWPYRIEIAGTTARFIVMREGTSILLVEATNCGEALGWKELPQFTEIRDSRRIYHHVPGTFALHLALADWPLIRSRELWERRHQWSDMGQPEGLALKIAIFEAVDREHHYDVRTPRIPGLDYSVPSLPLGPDVAI